MGNWITCISVGNFKEALTRGHQYRVLHEDTEKRQVNDLLQR